MGTGWESRNCRNSIKSLNSIKSVVMRIGGCEVHDLDLIRERVDLHDLAEEAGAEFRNDSSRCPLHGGDNPTAFHIYEDGRKWHCFTNCPDGENDGDVFAFYMRWKGVELKEAGREWARGAGAMELATGSS